MNLETGLKTSSYEFFPVNEMKKILREVVVQCSERGLYFSAKWYFSKQLIITHFFPFYS